MAEPNGNYSPYRNLYAPYTHAIILRTPGVGNVPAEKDFISGKYGDSPVQNIDPNDFAASIKNAILTQVRQTGHTDELVLDSHGGPNSLFPGGEADKWKSVKLEDYLTAVQQAQAQLRVEKNDPNFTIANRLVVAGCDCFADLNDKQIADYSARAKSLGMDIVGATSVATPIAEKAQLLGRFAKFGKDGGIGYDPKYDAGPQFDQWRQQGEGRSQITSDSYRGGNEWLEAYAGRTAAAGKASRLAPSAISTMFKTLNDAHPTKAPLFGDANLEEKKLLGDMSAVYNEFNYSVRQDPKTFGPKEQGLNPENAKFTRTVTEQTATDLANYLEHNPDRATALLGAKSQQFITHLREEANKMHMQALAAGAGIDASRIVQPGAQPATPATPTAPAHVLPKPPPLDTPPH